MRRSIVQAWGAPVLLAASTLSGLAVSLLATGGWRWIGCVLVVLPPVVALLQARRRAVDDDAP